MTWVRASRPGLASRPWSRYSSAWPVGSLLISPTRAATADTRANIEHRKRDRTIVLTKALETLKAQYAGLDASRAALEDVSVQVPTTADESAFRRVLAERAATSGVTIMSVTDGRRRPL